uniref:Sugar phosphate transporter domain-containing protein n=1 Tax=Trichuris muris TaxID=70415 RepID=A0A5S6QVN0_TRIMR
MPNVLAKCESQNIVEHTTALLPPSNSSADRSPSNVMLSDNVLKWTTLAVLTLQSSTYAVAVRYSKVRLNATDFLQTSVVLLGEMIKLLFSLIACFCTEKRATNALAQHLLDLRDLIRVGGLSFLYTIQNNLVFFSMVHLNPTVAQVVQQAKLLFTAGFAVCLLGQRLSVMRWFSLLVLAAGVSIVQVTQHFAPSGIASKGNLTMNFTTHHAHSRMEVWMGFSAAIAACVLSGFTGVYLEKVLKRTSPSVWIRNVQLSITALPIGLFLMLSEKHGKRFDNVFVGYDWLILIIILLFASGGILVALAIKYADNILKGFATSLSIILTFAISVTVFGFVVDKWFLLGALLVIVSLAMYLTY